ncbi:pyridoxal phosphate-dependent transferase [Dactylonectria macrodidyma]|uniref:Pyridoxal phosphate-dependent transferase n=1 Tax=Dactylonectria macrodidyma TaxID=307937 RepID=A0A9P9D4N9_9HYPO|nr:pyridoxal phosphate-dependent transferase [Dactylonectria macrodidyma]
MSTDGLLPAAWRIKMVEKIHRSTRDQREKWIQNANYNLFNLRSYQVFIDLLTDSGTGSMSDHQWAALLTGDETYAGSSSFTRLHDKVKTLFGFDKVLPVHQGRAAEHALFAVLVKEGDVVPGNSHFDTTRAHIEYRKAKAVDCPMDDAFCVKSCDKFKGNVNIKKLRSVLDTNRGRVPLILVTITCNKSGGQPVSIDNMRQIKDLANRDRIPVIFDSARFAENAWFIQKREPGYHNKSIQEIVREMYKYADGMMMSGKKDGLVNIGGILAMRSTEWFKKASDYVFLFEGFTQYGGLAGRDMDALAVGLSEVTDLDYLDSRIGQVRRFGETLLDADIPVQQPIGGHCIAIDACAFLPLVPRGEYVAQTLAVDLYLEAGVRGVEIGTILDGRDPSTGKNRHPQAEFMRLAIPRRVYMNEHLDLVANALIRIYRRRNAITRGFRISEEAKTLRHFTIRLERLARKEIRYSG